MGTFADEEERDIEYDEYQMEVIDHWCEKEITFVEIPATAFPNKLTRVRSITFSMDTPQIRYEIYRFKENELWLEEETLTDASDIYGDPWIWYNVIQPMLKWCWDTYREQKASEKF